MGTWIERDVKEKLTEDWLHSTPLLLEQRVHPARGENARRRPEAQIVHVLGVSSHPCTTPAGMMMMSPGLTAFFTPSYAMPPQVGPFKSGEGLWRPLTM